MQGSTFGQCLKRLRKERGFTLQALAKKCGLSHSYISNLENGHKGNPAIETIMRLSVALGVDYKDLLAVSSGDDNKVRKLLLAATGRNSIDQCKREIAVMLQKVDAIKSALQQALEELGDVDE